MKSKEGGICVVCGDTANAFREIDRYSVLGEKPVRRDEMNSRFPLAGLGALAMASIFLAPGILVPQDVIENPRKPAAVDAGRLITLQEIWKIADDGGAFYFKYPGRLRMASDGTIFLWDEQELLKFTADGTFVRNLFKKGAGPGEMSPSFSYLIDGPEILIYDGDLIRLWRMDMDGKFLGDVPLADRTGRGFLGAWKNSLIFFHDGAPDASGGIPGFADIPQIIMFLSKEGKKETEISPFFFRRYLVPGGGLNWGNSIKAQSEDGRFIFGFHGREYLIEVLDLEQKKIVRRFKRDYPRVPDPETPDERAWRDSLKLPRDEYESDITGLIPNGPRLWVRTSTEDPVKGTLWDIFDAEGRYVDCFYLGAGRTLLRAAGDLLFVLEQNKDETYRLVKYSIAD
jgi:hypothetical protein